MTALVGGGLLIALVVIEMAVVLFYVVLTLLVLQTVLLWLFWVLVHTPSAYEALATAAWRTALLGMGGAVVMALFTTFGNRWR